MMIVPGKPAAALCRGALVVLWVVALGAGCSSDPRDENNASNNTTGTTGGDMAQVDMPAAVDMPVAEDMPADMRVEPDMATPTDMSTPTDMRVEQDMAADMEADDSIVVTRLRVDQISPTRGPLEGGTAFVITGAGFTDDTGVFFGGRRATVRLVDGALVGEAPVGVAPGPVTLKVQDATYGDDTLPDGYTYTTALTLSALSPDRLPTRGGVEVTLQGAGFDAQTRVSFGGQTALQHTLVSDRVLRVLAPPHAAGAVDVRATNRDASAVLPEGATYFEALTITSVVPATGPTAGGQQATIFGTALEAGMTVDFGGQPALVLSVEADGSKASVRTPAHPEGLINVQVTSTAGDAALAQGAYFYSDSATPALARVTPSEGPLSGGIDVELLGAALNTAGITARIGGKLANITNASAGRLLLKLPVGDALGAVDVTIEDAAGTILDTLPGAFTYVQDLWIDRVTPSTGDAAGGTTLTIEGEGFTNTTRVLIGGAPATFTVTSPTTLEVTTPPHSAGKVDIIVERGQVRATFRDGFTYTEPLEVFGFSPVRGSVAGNTYVEVRGRGFVSGAQVRFGQEDGVDVQVIDSATLSVRTPPQNIGTVPVSVTLGQDTVQAADQYTYFNPGARFGGAWGAPIQGAVNVTVYSSGGGPIDGAFVMLSTRAETVYQGTTNPDGMVTLSGPDVLGEQTITATAAGHSSATVQRVDAENVTILLDPPPNPQQPPPGPQPATFTGNLTGLNKVAIPGPGEFLMAVVVTSQVDRFTDNPPPGDGGVLLNNGPYTITSRLGDVALIALGGLYNNNTQTFTPLSMGIKRYLFASEGQTQTVDIDLNIPLDQTLPVKLTDVPTLASGTVTNQAQAWLDLGFEGVFGELPVGTSTTDLIQIEHLPALSGDLANASYFIEGGAYASTGALSVGMADGITTLGQLTALPTLLGIPEITTPQAGGSPTNGVVQFNYNSPNRPDFFYVRFETFMQQKKWDAFFPGTVNGFQLPTFPDFSHLPAEDRPVPYTGEPLIMLIIAIDKPGAQFNTFTYNDLDQRQWDAYALTYQFIVL